MNQDRPRPVPRLAGPDSSTRICTACTVMSRTPRWARPEPAASGRRIIARRRWRFAGGCPPEKSCEDKRSIITGKDAGRPHAMISAIPMVALVGALETTVPSKPSRSISATVCVGSAIVEGPGTRSACRLTASVPHPAAAPSPWNGRACMNTIRPSEGGFSRNHRQRQGCLARTRSRHEFPTGLYRPAPPA